MYRLKHFGNRTLREGADSYSATASLPNHRTVKSSRIIARSEQHLYRVVWFQESVTSHHGPLSQPSNPSRTRRHPLPHSHRPTVYHDHSMGWNFYQHVPVYSVRFQLASLEWAGVVHHDSLSAPVAACVWRCGLAFTLGPELSYGSIRIADLTRTNQAAGLLTSAGLGGHKKTRTSGGCSGFVMDPI
jgi:hypothetical protein